MKNLFSVIFFLLFVSLSAFSQNFPVDSETKKITYQETVQIDSLNKQTIYERSKDWMVHFYKTSKLQLDNKEAGKITQEGLFNVQITYDFKYKTDYAIAYTINISVKEGKYRYIITDFNIYDVKNGPKTAQSLESFYAKMRTGSKAEFVTKFNDEINLILENLKTHVKTGLKKNEDDW
ncbi:MAG: DUF4468 domain-containing protein [Cytophagaceae bacterium]